MNGPGTPPYAGAFVPYEYDPEDDLDAGEDDRLIEAKTYGWNARGAMNVVVLLLLTSAIVSLFTVYPVLSFFLYGPIRDAISNNVQVNATGQAPVLATIPKLVDDATPDDVKQRVGFDGHEYELVFSDEFNTDNRSFAPGDDPFWEAVDLYYWPTKDMQWYDPDQVTTADGYLRIKLEQIDPSINHDLSLKSGMLQSWNKFCFTNGYIEIRAQLPGPPNVAGYWPGAWTMGNLARPGYGATSDGTWPYTYDTCNVGIVRNQSFDGVNPPAAFNLDPSVGRSNYNYDLSWLAGQKISACTCEGEDHPGPHAKRGRGAPEIDILEAEKDKHGRDGGSVSQSAQFAPFSANYLFDETQVQVLTPDITQLNNYKQQAVSALTETSDDIYNAGRGGGQFGVFAFEYFGDPNDPANSYITWVSEGRQTFTMRGTSIGPDEATGVGQRLISPEPMAIMLNLAVSTSFQPVDLPQMTFPAEFLIDYVRVYQRKGSPESAIGCDPPDYPTLDYINRHINAYTNPNLTTWEMAGYSWPQNTLVRPARSLKSDRADVCAASKTPAHSSRFTGHCRSLLA
ncbi:glycoside hydrolase family 16 protein [Auricularia subglabra TFB-10046 SS5]|nr:glycoside hydrolase family 16 protein [Auricularia subglabra TFB-10046 SS5]